LVGADLAVPWGFYAFGLTGVLALAAVLLVPRSQAPAARPATRPRAETAANA
jgi:hypothetical protein